MRFYENYTITVTNEANQTLVLKGANPDNYGLTEVEGVEATEYKQNINTNGNLPGGSLSSTKVMPRTIDLSFTILRNANEQSNRLYFEKFFNPYENLTLTVSRLNVSRRIVCRVDGRPRIEQAWLQAHQTCSVSLVALQPFFMDTTDFGRDLATTTGMFAPPFLMNADSGQVMGILQSANIATLKNDGDLDVGFVVRFVAIDNVENVTIYNARTGDYVTVMDTMSQGNVITISTMDGNKTVSKRVGAITTNIINKIDRSSTFFKIGVGTNLIGYTADTGETALHVWVDYTPLYYGV